MEEIKNEEELKKYEEEIRKEITNIKTKELINTTDRLKTLILYSIERVDYYEDYRHRYLTISTALIAFSITFITFIYKDIGILNAPNLIGFIIGASILAIFCFINIFFYLFNSIYPNYPHRPIAKSSWFYRYNLSINSDNKYEGTKFIQSRARARVSREWKP
jgi:hypothetical protein